MRGFLSPYGQELWTITVPFDYDGYADVGVNYGDYMADKWEERCFPEPHYDIRYVQPFLIQWPQTNLADRDSIPTGRDIDGDGFCNFAEYRGLMIAKDPANPSLTHEHRRLDPARKSVVIHVRTNMDNVVRAQIPGYIYKLPDAEIVFTDSIRFSRTPLRLSDEAGIERARYDTVGRDVNFNRAGAGLWYPGFALPITYPMPQGDTIRAVTFWNWTPDEWILLLRRNVNPEFALGVTWGYPAFYGSRGRTAHIPRMTTRCMLNTTRFDEIRQRYYAGDPSRWQHDFGIVSKGDIAHEFGHAVGMLDTLRSQHTTGIMCRDTIDTHGFVIFATDSAYSDTSQAEFSVKERQP
jgi:hypothetical protein